MGPRSRPHIEMVGPVLDTADPIGLATFYAELLGWPIVEQEGPRDGYPQEDGWAKLRSPAGDLKMQIQWDAHYTPPVWPAVPGAQQMMVHLDFAVADLEAGKAWAIECGASLAEHQPQELVRVMLDPAGHPFCLFEG